MFCLSPLFRCCIRRGVVAAADRLSDVRLPVQLIGIASARDVIECVRCATGCGHMGVRFCYQAVRCFCVVPLLGLWLMLFVLTLGRWLMLFVLQLVPLRVWVGPLAGLGLPERGRCRALTLAMFQLVPRCVTLVHC